MRTLLIIILFLSSVSFSQTSVSITAEDSVFCGLCTEITATGVYPDYSVSFDFSSGWPTGWDVPASGMLGSPCSVGSYAWMGNATAAPRTLATNGFNTNCGGTICFDFRMAPPGTPAPCEDPDLPTEGMYFEYSTDGGWTWFTIEYFNPTTYGAYSYEDWETYCYVIPILAQTSNTMFRWHQEDASGFCCDHWGIDNVDLTVSDCGFYYDWTHIAGFPNPATITVCPNVDTTYEVIFTNGFDPVTAQVSIDVWFSDVELSLNTSSPIDSCGGCIQINGTIINPEAVAYTWDWDGPNITIINDSTILACPSNDAEYVVTLSANGCSASDTVSVDVNIPIPDDVLTVSPNLCNPALMMFDNSMPISNCKYIFYSPQNSYIYNGCAPFSYTFTEAGMYDVLLIAMTPEGCIIDSLYEDFFEVYQTPIASFFCTPNEGTIIENLIQITNTTFGGEYYEWDLGDGTTSYDHNLTHEYLEIGVYDIELIVSTQWDCADTTYGSILIKDDIYLYVPNAFTPDGNDYNNTFKPVISRHNIYNYSMTIYNRWGETMFVSNNSDVGWDGTYGDGGLVDDGVYIWVIRVVMENSSAMKEYTGHVTLIK